MSKTKMPSRKSAPVRTDQETQAAEIVTVGWTLTVMTTFMCDVGAAVTRILVATYADPATQSLAAMAMLSGLLLLAAIAVGLLSFVLLTAVLLMRREKPPLPLVVFSIVAAIAPIAAALAMQLPG